MNKNLAKNLVKDMKEIISKFEISPKNFEENRFMKEVAFFVYTNTNFKLFMAFQNFKYHDFDMDEFTTGISNNDKNLVLLYIEHLIEGLEEYQIN